jgi:hypothetical protein
MASDIKDQRPQDQLIGGQVATRSWSRTAALGAGAAAIALFVAAFVPHWTITFNDDVGYLRSVVETIQHRRPWTDEFLEPWSMSLSLVSAAIYEVTGRFSFATVGLQCILPALSFVFAARFLLRVTGTAVLAALVPAAVLTFPTLLWKQAEFTALIVYIPALFAALWATSARRWFVFGLAYAIAVGSRQSAVAWLALPVAFAAHALWRGEGRCAIRPAVVVVGGLVWFGALQQYANDTHARRFITANLLWSIDARVFAVNIAVSALVVATVAGVAALIAFVAQPGGRKRPGPWRRTACVLVGLALLACVPFVARSIPLSFEHPLFDNTWAATYLRGLVVVGAAGWLVSAPRIAGPLACAAAAAAGLASMRAELWDYYLLDAAIFILWGAFAGSPSAGAFASGPARSRIWIAAAVLGGIIGAHVAATGALKRSLDERAAACAVLEKALRAEWMKPTELSHAPFGFVAWHLFPYYVRHDGADSANLAGFGIYVGQHVVDVCTDPVRRSERRRQLPADRDHAFSEVRPRGWFRYARYYLVRRSDSVPPEVTLKWSEYRYVPFPLNDDEWRALIRDRSTN